METSSKVYEYFQPKVLQPFYSERKDGFLLLRQKPRTEHKISSPQTRVFFRGYLFLH